MQNNKTNIETNTEVKTSIANKSSKSNMEDSPLFVELEVEDAVFTPDIESINPTNPDLVLNENEQFSRSLPADNSSSNLIFYSTRMMPTVNTDDVVSFAAPAPGTPAAEALAG